MKKQKSFFGELFSNLAGVGVDVMVGNLRTAANDAMDDAQKRVQNIVAQTLKAAAIFIFMIFGLILALVGYGQYLSATVPSLAHGLGFVAIGGVLIVLGLLIQFFRK